MDDQQKKTALRMIPYGLYVLTCEHGDQVAAATVNWLAQTSFAPPLITVAIKEGSGAHTLVKEKKSFALSMLGKNDAAAAFAFFKPTEKDGDTLNGQAVINGSHGHPLLKDAPAFLECNVVEFIETGDHSVVIAEVINAGVNKEPEGRPDDHILLLKDLGEKVFYGG